jgi:hypothetical protein
MRNAQKQANWHYGKAVAAAGIYAAATLMQAAAAIVVAIAIAIKLPRENSRAYAINNLIAADQAINAAIAGDPDETISSRAAKRRSTCRACDWLCRALDAIDTGHCQDSIEPDEGDAHLGIGTGNH